jgi:hypothetical protein
MASAPTLREFRATPHHCRFCGALLSHKDHPSDPDHPGSAHCQACNRTSYFLRKDREVLKRPHLKRGGLDELWAAWGGCCAHCGLTEHELKVLGVPRTHQHVPPWAQDNEDVYHIPLCAWCQGESQASMTRLKALVKRIEDARTWPKTST